MKRISLTLCLAFLIYGGSLWEMNGAVLQIYLLT